MKDADRLAPNRLVYEVSEVAEFLGLKEWRVYELARLGRLPTLRIGRTVKIPKDRFHAWLNGEGAPSTE